MFSHNVGIMISNAKYLLCTTIFKFSFLWVFCVSLVVGLQFIIYGKCIFELIYVTIPQLNKCQFKCKRLQLTLTIQQRLQLHSKDLKFIFYFFTLLENNLIRINLQRLLLVYSIWCLPVDVVLVEFIVF